MASPSIAHLIAHFERVDPSLAAVIDPADDWYVLTRRRERFPALCRIIVGQQVSTKAAAAIYDRFRAQFPNKHPSARAVARTSDANLRAAGLSGAKCRAIRDLATRVARGELPLSRLARMSDADVIAALTQVRGIGQWSAEMFLLFTLGHEDVFSPGDLGLRNAIARVHNKRRVPTPQEAERIARRWAPYRSYACRILWNHLDNDPS